MKKLIVSALLITGFAAAAMTLPGYDIVIKVTEKSAAACDQPGCDAE